MLQLRDDTKTEHDSAHLEHSLGADEGSRSLRNVTSLVDMMRWMMTDYVNAALAPAVPCVCRVARLCAGCSPLERSRALTPLTTDSRLPVATFLHLMHSGGCVR
ncbi:unnamed protein product [Euphydryas editha]|uniref:Uncharacterized protein n=1 Tax=Euphydryas editha TaxID=104508 RepID=A0AAU9UL30_EUPED|nr:unnamed protein product [Euphydryas editha]